MASTIKCLVSAGPTREYFDPVRFLSNPSTGKMGYAIAEAAVAKGWSTTLVSGPVALEPPPGVDLIQVVTGAEMYRAIDDRFGDCDILIMTAAVVDYRPVNRSDRKVKKHDLKMTVEMEPVVDILATVASRKGDQLVVGFAAETENLETYARMKLEAKNADFIVGNIVGAEGSGFGSDDNEIVLYGRDGSVHSLGRDSKQHLAAELIRVFTRTLEARVVGSPAG